MSSKRIAAAMIDDAFAMLADHVFGRGDPAVARGNRTAGLSIEAALFTPHGGYRSSLGTIKHIGGWARVYHSFAFDRAPVGWDETSWPRGLRDTIVPSQDYLDEVIEWATSSKETWGASLAPLADDDLAGERPVHWGTTMPLIEITAAVANHVVYHTGELNQLLALLKQEGWEEGEQVEENHRPSDGHRVRPLWMTDS